MACHGWHQSREAEGSQRVTIFGHQRINQAHCSCHNLLHWIMSGTLCRVLARRGQLCCFHIEELYILTIFASLFSIS